MLLTPDAKMVIMKEYAQNLIFRQYHIQVSLDITFPLWITTEYQPK